MTKNEVFAVQTFGGRHVRQNTNQTIPKAMMATPVPITKSTSTDGPVQPAVLRSEFRQSDAVLFLLLRFLVPRSSSFLSIVPARIKSRTTILTQ